MRQVFSSIRLETVEGVAKLLRDAGIQVRITNGRAYKGARRGTFSYRDPDTGPKPTLWIVSPDDQPRARELLRAAGLFETSRPDADAATMSPFVSQVSEATAPSARLRRIIRMVLGLLIVAVVLGISRL